MTEAVALQMSPGDAAMLETILVNGDLSKLSPAQRLSYYRKVCETLGLNPFTRPFSYIVLNGKLQLYANRDCADQLRSIHGVSVRVTEREVVEGVYVVTAEGEDKQGRHDTEIGAVPIEGLTGEARANAFMKASTKAKRRLTLSMVGLGWLDESEVSSVPGARIVDVDPDTGEIVQATAQSRRTPGPAARKTQAQPAPRQAPKDAWEAVKGHMGRLHIAGRAIGDCCEPFGVSSVSALSKDQAARLAAILETVADGTPVPDVIDRVLDDVRGRD